jgi:hypothetical protein
METARTELALLCAVPADLHRAAAELAGSLSTGECAGCSGPPTSLASRHRGPSSPCNMPPTGSTEGRADKGRAEREAQRVKLRFCSFPSAEPRQRACFPADSGARLFWEGVWHSFVRNSSQSCSRSCAKGTLILLV